MSVVVSVEEVGPCRKKLAIEVPAAAVSAEMDRVVAEFGRQARIPGFRKGKVPTNLVRQRFAHDIEHEVVDRLLPRFWRQAQAESNLDPLLPPQVENVELRAGEPLRFVATVEVRPPIELGNTKDFQLPEPTSDPTGEEVDRALEDLRRNVADWVVVERPAARGDRVAARLADLGSSEGPQPVSFEVGDPAVWEELGVAASGLQAGQATELVRKHGEGEHVHEHRYRLEVTEVREQRLPDIDDEFAKKLGNFEDLPALKKDVEARLGAAKRIERRRQREQALIDQLRERHPVPLPEGVVEHEREQLMQEFAENLARRGVDPERAQVDWQRLADDLKPQAEKRVHARLLLDAVAQAEDVTVSEEEFERALGSIARLEGRSTSAVRQALDEAGRLGQLRAQLRREKTLDRLLGERADAAAQA
ncbi:MAG: trigger factor [Acidobacteriota bacterium]